MYFNTDLKDYIVQYLSYNTTKLLYLLNSLTSQNYAEGCRFFLDKQTNKQNLWKRCDLLSNLDI